MLKGFQETLNWLPMTPRDSSLVDYYRKKYILEKKTYTKKKLEKLAKKKLTKKKLEKLSKKKLTKKTPRKTFENKNPPRMMPAITPAIVRIRRRFFFRASLGFMLENWIGSAIFSVLGGKIFK